VQKCITASAKPEGNSMSNTLSSKIDDAKKVAVHLEERVAAVERANENRDKCLYNLLGRLHRLDQQLRQTPRTEAIKVLKPGGLPFAPNWVNLLLKCTYPNLSAKTRSKYAAALRYVGLKKEPGQKVMDFVRENGGLNGCVEKEKKLRAKKQKMGKGLGRTRTRRP
jgi:hypothetical protein